MFQTLELLLIVPFLQSSDGGRDCDSRGCIVGPGTTGSSFHAGGSTRRGQVPFLFLHISKLPFSRSLGPAPVACALRSYSHG